MDATKKYGLIIQEKYYRLKKRQNNTFIVLIYKMNSEKNFHPYCYAHSRLPKSSKISRQIVKTQN